MPWYNASWNLKEFGHLKNRLPETYFYIAEILNRFDLVAVQEVNSTLTDLDIIMRLLGENGHTRLPISRKVRTVILSALPISTTPNGCDHQAWQVKSYCGMRSCKNRRSSN
jgi:hypothetical protein